MRNCIYSSLELQNLGHRKKKKKENPLPLTDASRRKAARRDYTDGHTPRTEDGSGRICTAPVKKVNPKSLALPRKSERDGPDSQSARGRRLSACEQSANPPNRVCVCVPHPPPHTHTHTQPHTHEALFNHALFGLCLHVILRRYCFYNLICYFNVGASGYAGLGHCAGLDQQHRSASSRWGGGGVNL